jgi:uncharacterized membrane protein YfcA
VASYLLLIGAALGAGLLNSIAGGGSFLTFPALVFTGVPSIIANATSTVALFPGALASAWAYRDDFKALDQIPLKPALAVSVAGGITGALLLLYTSQHTFDVIMPWLLLAATIMFALGPRLTEMLRRQSSTRSRNPAGRSLKARSASPPGRSLKISPRMLVILQFLIGVYGGYFGGAVGIFMLAVWSVAGMQNIHAMNGGRTLLGGVMNAAAVICFVIAGKVWWLQTSMMLIAAVAGGYIGATVARRTNPTWIRSVIVVISVAVTVAFFLRS